MLDITLNLSTAAAMLLSMVVHGFHFEVDSSNSPTAKPILGGGRKVGVS